MIALRSLVWKEFREALVYLWIGLFVFLALPLIGLLEAKSQSTPHVELETSGWVLSLGGVLAVFAAVGATCRDLRPRLMDFWQSRPVRPWQWMTVKFAVGLAIVWLACVTPLVAEGISSRDKPIGDLLWIVMSLFAATYGIAFLAGTLVRRTAHAAMLALAAMLLLWFLPTILPPLKWFDVPAVLTRKNPSALLVHFVIGMGSIALAVLLLSLFLVQRGWQIRSGPRLMCGVLGGAVLLLVGSLSLKLGTNLPQIASFSLDAGERQEDVVQTGDHEWTLTTRRNSSAGGTYYALRKIEVADAGMTVSAAQPFVTPPLPQRWADLSQTPAADIRVRYGVGRTDDAQEASAAPNFWLNVAVIGQPLTEHVANLWPADREDLWPTVYVYQNRLFVFDSRFYAVFDVTDPHTPREMTRSAWAYSRRQHRVFGDVDTEIVSLPDLPGLPPRQRLDAVIGHGWGLPLDGDLAVVYAISSRTLMGYQLTALSEQVAQFKRISRQPNSPLTSIFGQNSYGSAVLKNGLLYRSHGGAEGNGLAINPSFDVLDVRDNFKAVAHFAAPGSGWVVPLNDGRVLTAGSKVYLVGPVKR